VEKNFDMLKLLTMNNITWNFLLTGNAPYAKVKVDSEYGIYNYSSLLYIETTGYEVYLSTPILLQNNEVLPKELQLNLSEQQRIDIQRFFHQVQVTHLAVSQAILIQGNYYFFKGNANKQGEQITIDINEQREKFDIPTEIEQDLRGNVQVVDINKLY
jgi:hypothetical protein